MLRHQRFLHKPKVPLIFVHRLIEIGLDLRSVYGRDGRLQRTVDFARVQ